MNLENEKTKAAYEMWLNFFPESTDQRDLKRFDELSLILLETDDELSDFEISSAMGDNYEEEKADYLFNRFHEFSDFYILMREHGYSK